MTDVLNKYIDICISIVVIGVCAALVASFMVFAQKPIIEQYDDKTMQLSAGAQIKQPHILKGEDVLLMLLNTDPMTPYPVAIRLVYDDVVTPVIKLDSAFQANQVSNVAAIYSQYGQWKLSTVLDRVVTDMTYIYDDPDSPYIQIKF